MKHLFVFLFVLFGLWAIAVYFLNPTHESDLPVIYWVTDRNPVREEQVDRFLDWMKENGHPDIELRLDTSNADVSKKIIQGVSGVGSDLIDLPSDQLSFFVQMGLLKDVTELAKELGFSTDNTYASLKETLTVNGRQYAFPANLDVSGMVINVDQFKKLGLPIPSGNWTLEEFEKAGLEYVKKANEGLPRQLFFFSAPIGDQIGFLRGLGGDQLNETLTAANVNSPEYIRMLGLLKRWTDIGIFPTAADVQSMATDSGYGGAMFQLFNNGNYGMIQVGRHAIILMRQVGGDKELSVVPAPADVLPNATIRTRAVGVYSGSRHPELAPYFLSYLASDLYNETVVSSGDGLPSSPSIALTEEYNKPEGRKNEWDFHKHFANYANEMTIPLSISPYILPAVMTRSTTDAYGSVTANLRTPEQAAAIAQSELDRELQLTLRERPEMQEEYAMWAERQKKIDALKAEGKKIPAEWVRNPFHQLYYKKLGMLEEPAPQPAAAPAAEAEKAKEQGSATEAKPAATPAAADASAAAASAQSAQPAGFLLAMAAN